MTIFPLAPDQTIAQMWTNGVQGGALTRRIFHQIRCEEIIKAEDVCFRNLSKDKQLAPTFSLLSCIKQTHFVTE